MFLAWMSNDDSPFENLDSLRGLAWQQAIAWSRRGDPDVVLLHYADLSRNLAAQMRLLAERLGIEIPEQTWPALVRAATFDHMRERADDLVPDERQPIFKARSRFFHSGTSGQWREWLTADDAARYEARIAALTTPDLARWLHHGAELG
jgi:aryl sulfotransferase